jgi:wyosine [tRNA(Phe)-imidazoG37] synthetase (radical SAM superfamily)
MQPSTPSDSTPFDAHPRTFAANRYVYPVLSRRAGGISIGVNLNLDRFCNFNCIYCQIDRSLPDQPEGVDPRWLEDQRASGGLKGRSWRTREIDLKLLEDELDRMVASVTSGNIFKETRFKDTPAPLRRLNDIALSGNGEPTASPNFDRAVEVCAEIRRRHGLDDLKLVLITNASLLHLPKVQLALQTLDANGGEIWAKLDAGTEAYYRLVDRSAIHWRQILDNLREAALARPIVIQSLFMRIHGEPPPPAEVESYCKRLKEIADAGGQIKLVQIHTIARKPAESWVTALADAEVEGLAELVRCRTSLTVAAFSSGMTNG